MPLTIFGPAQHFNGYNQAYPRYRTFMERVNLYSASKQTVPVSHARAHSTDKAVRRLVAVDDGLNEIAYPITTIDSCDCVTFPDAEFTLTECGTDVEWGVFQVQFTDQSCYDVAFDETEVYANCPSGMDGSTEMYTEYVWCEVDFTEGTDTPEDFVYADGSTTSARKKISSEETTTTSLRQEPPAKTQGHTHIHLTIHRMLTQVLEAVLALQYPST